MSLNIKSFFVVIAILMLGTFLYFYKIDTVPPRLSADEIPSGYNAYSILLTGKDEYGKSFPISFRFSSSYSPPLYVYLTVPAISIFGLNATGTRIVSILSGVISIMVIFIFLKNLNVIQSRIVVYLGVLLYTISPWAVMYSRSGYEAMLSFLFYSLSVFTFWEGFKRPYFLTIGIILLSVSTYASHANKFLLPVLLVGLILTFRKILFDKKNRRYFIAGLVGALIVQLPNLSVFLTKSFFVKSSLFFNDAILIEYQKIKAIVPVFVGIPYLYVREFLSQYLTYFSLRSLFLDPDPFQARSIPNLSVFYPWMFIPFIIGLFVAWKNRAQTNYKYLLLLAVTAPVPAAFTKDPFWTYRAIPLLLPLIIIITIGIDRILKLRLKLFITLFCILIIYSLILLWRGYFVFLPNEKASAWEYGYQNIAQEIMTRKGEHFVVDNSRNSLTYIQLAFYLKLNPETLQNAVGQEIKEDYYNNTTINSNYSFEKLEVRPIFWQNDIYKEQILVGDRLTFSDQQIREHKLMRVFQIKDPLNNIVFEGYKTNPQEKCAYDRMMNNKQNSVCKQ